MHLYIMDLPFSPTFKLTEHCDDALCNRAGLLQNDVLLDSEEWGTRINNFLVSPITTFPLLKNKIYQKEVQHLELSSPGRGQQ